MSVDYLLAWLLPVFAGAGLWCAFAFPRARSDWAAVIGGGWLLGVLLAGAIGRAVGSEDTVHVFSLAAPWLAGLGALAWIVAGAWRVWRRRQRGSSDSPARAGIAPDKVDASGAGSVPMSVLRILGAVVLALIVLRLFALGSEALLRPVFPWDAWTSWALKPKTWFLLGKVVPYVPVGDWLVHPQQARTVLSWDYPELLAWIQLWFASAAGGWIEPLVNLAWCGVLAALALLAYGQWRAIGLRPWLALLLVYALVSLPLIDAHVALAGYADLWVAAVLGAAVMCWSRWLRQREPGQWLLAVALALWLPAIKLEGAVWQLALLAMIVFDRIPPRWRWPALSVAAGLLVAGFLLGGFALPMAGLGWVDVAWTEVVIPGIGDYALHWRATGSAMAASLFELPNWHLLWYLLPMLIVWRFRALRSDPAARLLGGLLLLCAGFLFVLFFLTSASAWAQDFTSANRLILQVVPLVFAFAAMLLVGRGPTTATH